MYQKPMLVDLNEVSQACNWCVCTTGGSNGTAAN